MPSSRWFPGRRRLYNGLLATDRPSDAEFLRDYGMPRVRTPSTGNYFSGSYDETTPADIAHVRSTFPAAYFTPGATTMFVNDVEAYSMGFTEDLSDRQFGAAQLIAYNNELRRLCPDIPIGMYAVCPDRQFFTPVNRWVGTANQDEIDTYDAWVAHNADVAALVAASVDFVCPSLYAFHKTDEAETDGSGWKNIEEQTAYLTYNVLQATQYGRPVIPFIWPEIHPSNGSFGGERLTGWQWRWWLDTLWSMPDVDGLIIWGLSGNDWSTESALDWWTETLDFMADEGL